MIFHNELERDILYDNLGVYYFLFLFYEAVIVMTLHYSYACSDDK